MPFTLAHPAAILPLRHVWRLRTAPLILGAVTPDLPYYVPSAVSAHLVHDTHSLVGSIAVDLPLGLAGLACAFLLRGPLTVLLPARARWLCLNALAPFRGRLLEWALAPLAILVGVWTHLAWDSFTHLDGWAVRRITALSQTVTIGGYTGELCHILQYLSSVIGLAILAVWYSRLRAPAAARAGEATRRSSAGPALLLVVSAALLIGGVQAKVVYYHSDGAIYHTLDTLLTRSLAWFAVLYLFAGTVVALDHRRGA
ncbi:MAG: DUF4184 family protein [Steroidobacteraceae bacterium]